MNTPGIYMQRCLQLARLGEGYVAPNPMVGSVLVYNDKIIGEGYHRQYGQAHAEVNCINSVQKADRDCISRATLYVSLEPCAHFGKTPPCADFIIASGIKKVVVGCTDPFDEVDGKGIATLRQAGVEVEVNILEEECRALNKRFFTFHQKKRPYVLLKWAQTNDGIIGSDKERLIISHPFTNRLVHQWRSSYMGILVGTNTALSDNPKLDSRLAAAPSPARLVIDLDNRLPRTLHVFDNSIRTIIFTYASLVLSDNTEWIQLHKTGDIPQQVVEACYKMNIQSILVEGGARTLQSFIDAGLWDEAIIIQNTTMIAGEGVVAPILKNAKLTATENMETDLISFYKKAGR
jgi:diaminohydroxyphosphoribosylaminopyrimidine deaminase/5-amino-6-(5-phosphoribosylamino)uracil reductase